MNYRFATRFLVPGVLLAAAALTTAATASPPKPNEQWVGTWSTAVHGPQTIPGQPGSPTYKDQTLRQIVHTSLGGDRVRVRLSTFGSGALVVGAAHIARRGSGSAIDPNSDRKLTFGGHASIRIPPGAIVVSDPVDLDVPALSDLAVSIFLPGATTPAAWHFESLQTSYVSPEGDFTSAADMPIISTAHWRDAAGAEHNAWYWLAGVEVVASKQTGAVVTFGDSITDGIQSTVDANARWPDHLARRLSAQSGHHKMGVLNGAITGNKLLNDIVGPNGLARFERDVLAQTGVSHVITLIGNNDLLFVFSPADVVTAEQIIQGHRQIIDRAHARGLKIFGGTLTPFEGFAFASPAKTELRQTVNDWIRKSSEYDAVIDFDEVLRDPISPARLLPRFDSGDHLHPNDAGYRAMAEGIELKLFQNDGNDQLTGRPKGPTR
jgi:lysophospholipase L1-like esterase